MDVIEKMAGMVPDKIRKHILEEKFIEKAFNTEVVGTPMEYLFDVYEEFLDPIGEFENWYCYKCREAVLNNWRKILPYLLGK